MSVFETPAYLIVDFDALPGMACPCGTARRAFGDLESYPATIHLTEISENAQLHHHEEHTETYVILACEPNAAIELDGTIHPVKPRMCILIPPGVRHRAIGRMTLLNIVMPKFDPADEHFD